MSKIDAAYKRRSISDAPVTFGSLVRVDGDNALQAGQYAGIGLNGKHERISQQHIIQLSQALTKKNRSMSVTERVRYKILADLADSQASQEQVARQLGLSSRTLRRKLSFEGHSYQELLDECRMQLAVREFTTSPCVSLSQMALKLGYTEHSTFTRAFGRWSGVAPKEYRIAAVDFKDKGASL